MGRPILLLRLEGPIQSWGTRSRWDVRDTGLEPTKSGIIGLLGCAFGYLRQDPRLEDLDRSLIYSVRVDSPGVISTDFHTVSGYHRLANGGYKFQGGTASSMSTAIHSVENTIVSHRDYLHDARFLVGLEGEHSLLLEIEKKLTAPTWPLFLGRKSCIPTRPIFERLTVEYETTEHVFQNYPWFPDQRQSNANYHADSVTLSAWIESPDGDHERQDVFRIHPLRYYDFRRCRHLLVTAPVHHKEET